ncbi:caspase family protein [Prosthecomicrobium hirschii]|nr:caspase family protein [Prosthecomicrobium hirschii]
MKRLLIIALSAVAFASPAMAGKRVALVIGNATYRAGPLANPERDVDAMAKAFRAAGFDAVQVHKNLTREGMSRALDAFEAASDGADVSVIYFSGHGLEINGTNYLLPVDAKVASAREVKFEAIPLDDLVQASHGATRLRLILLDACRDNPFVAQTRGASGKGLARVEASQADTLVAYATAAGATATDGDGKMSPFAAALAEHLFAPDLDVRIALGRVRDAVSKATEGRQRPYQVGSLGGDVVALQKSAMLQDTPNKALTQPVISNVRTQPLTFAAGPRIPDRRFDVPDEKYFVDILKKNGADEVDITRIVSAVTQSYPLKNLSKTTKIKLGLSFDDKKSEIKIANLSIYDGELHIITVFRGSDENFLRGQETRNYDVVPFDLFRSNTAASGEYAVPPLAQKAQLLEEGRGSSPQGQISSGRVVWQMVRESPGVGRPVVTMIKARVDVPDRGLVLNLSIQPNSDNSFPASHLIELKFEVPADFDNKGVSNVPGLILKQTEHSRGDPLVGAASRISAGFFWVALSKPEVEKQRNLGLLRERGWIDIPILFDNGRRGILTLEKNGDGGRVVADALTAWTQGAQ